ncbi:TonB-dependent receptor [Alteromonadaceae bacterium BrNp21-10]|nr:TonB-dependent receptor [Alteromonadaceae bacterium BrNp21-10]
MQHNSLALAISIALTSSPLLAADLEEQNLERVVVVSSRVAMPIREVATSVSVVTAEQIQDRGYANLADVLKAQPSVGVTNSGGAGSTTALRIRGEEGYRTLVRVDGVDISDPTGTQVQPQLGHLQSANISRVEILRGSQGMAYGADAGGVINIESGGYTDSVAGSVSAEYGRYDTRNISADVGGSQQQLDYYLALADYSTDGFNSRLSDNANPDNDGYDNTTVHARLGYKVNEQISVGLVARNNKGNGEFDSCGSGASASNNCDSNFEQRNVRASVNYSGVSSEHEFAFTKTNVERENFKDLVTSYFTKGSAERFEYLGHSNFNPDTRIIYGFDWEQESITSAEQSRTQKGYYLEYQSELLKDFFITAGARHDDNEDFGEHTSYRLSGAYIWALGEDELKLRSAYGTGFRAPSLYEIEYNRGPWAYAPASETNLKEETTKGYEVALEYTLASGTQLQVVYFDQKITDGIDFDLATYSGYLQVLGEARSKGIELIGDIVLGKHAGVTFNYTYNDAIDTEGEIRSRRPKHLANIGTYVQLNNIRLSANARLVRDFVDNGTPMDDYQVLDISGRYSVNNELTVFARIENAFNKDYQDLTAYRTSGSAAYAGLKYQF